MTRSSRPSAILRGSAISASALSTVTLRAPEPHLIGHQDRIGTDVLGWSSDRDAIFFYKGHIEEGLGRTEIDDGQVALRRLISTTVS